MLPRWRHVYTPADVDDILQCRSRRSVHDAQAACDKSMEYDRSVSLNTKCPGMNWNWNGMEGNECMRQNRE